jgi:hypothetical protein
VNVSSWPQGYLISGWWKLYQTTNIFLRSGDIFLYFTYVSSYFIYIYVFLLSSFKQHVLVFRFFEKWKHRTYWMPLSINVVHISYSSAKNPKCTPLNIHFFNTLYWLPAHVQS